MTRYERIALNELYDVSNFESIEIQGCIRLSKKLYLFWEVCDLGETINLKVPFLPTRMGKTFNYARKNSLKVIVKGRYREVDGILSVIHYLYVEEVELVTNGNDGLSLTEPNLEGRLSITGEQNDS